MHRRRQPTPSTRDAPDDDTASDSPLRFRGFSFSGFGGFDGFDGSIDTNVGTECGRSSDGAEFSSMSSVRPVKTFAMAVPTQKFPAHSCPADNVTVFVDRAEVTRTVNATLAVSGQHRVVLQGVSKFANPDSVRVKGEGPVTILEVRHPSPHFSSCAFYKWE